MNRWVKVLAIWAVLVFCFAPAPKVSSASTNEASLKALIVTGQSNPWHRWEASSPILKQILEQTGLFEVDMAISPPDDDGIEDFGPDFGDYDVVVLDYDGYDRKGWSKQTKKAFVKYVKSGGGVVVYHGANNSFPDWKEYNEMIGLGGWGGRDEKDGPMVRWREGKAVLDSSPGSAGSHGPAHEFAVVIRDRRHPIAKGLPEKWMHARDELYAQLRGPAKNLTVLATAYSDPAKKAGTGEHEPILFTVKYGAGRIFQTALGHARELPLPSMECVGFIVTFQRGAEWVATGKVTQKIPDDFPTATEVRTWKNYKLPKKPEELLRRISRYEHGQSRENLTELADIVRESCGSEQQRKDIEKRFLEFLRSDATLAGKQFICKQLSIIGTEEAVPTLAAMLPDAATSDMARYALERIPGSSVDEALRKALPKTTGKERIGIINTLGLRGDYKSVPVLGTFVYDSDSETAIAAVAALGQVADPQATEVLAQAKNKTGGKLRQVVLDAYLKCADELVARGEQAQALAIYKELYASGEPVLIRSAALVGMVTTSAEEAGGIVVDVLKGDDKAMQTVAIGLVRGIQGTKITEAVAAELPNLSAARQIQLLSALADRGDSAALPAVFTAAGARDESVRIAALKALASFGEGSAVVMLAQRAATTKGEEREAARESLYRLHSSEEIDGTILGGVHRGKPEVRVELVRSIGRRNIEGGVRTLLKTARDAEQNVRLESIKALRDIAAPKYLSVLVDLLIKARSEIELKETERTVVSVLRRSVGVSGTAGIVLDAIDSVEDINVRCSLLRVLGAIGDSKALGELREALEQDNAEVRIAAIRTLGDWPNAEPADDLLKVASGTDGEIQRALALRGFVRLIGLDSDRSANETVELYRQAMGLASDISEKKMALSGLANVESFAALHMASDYLKDNALQEEAGAAMVKIAEATGDSHPQQTKILLRMVIQISKNESLRERAQKMIEQIK
ncbi:MAG: HEAT repeat domain-containing protein [Planctomycetota bacterium]|jgi:HEAT repeat protein/type 1 glutamine amidotransferase